MATISLAEVLNQAGFQAELKKQFNKKYPSVAAILAGKVESDMDLQARFREAAEEQERAKWRIVCPTCKAIVGQREKDGTEIAQWDHLGPCGAQCAGKGHRKWYANNAKRKKYSSLHTLQMCPRCKPKKCPACLGKCLCPHCKGDGRIVVEYGVNSCICCTKPDRRVGEQEIFVQFQIPDICQHSCPRCNGRGKVDGLEAI